MKDQGKDNHSSVISDLSPSGFIRAAQKASPAFRYAIIGAGLISIVATLFKFKENFAALFFGLMILVAAMYLFLTFERFTQQQSWSTSVSGAIITLSISALYPLLLVGLASSVIVNRPLHLGDYLNQKLGGAGDVLPAEPPASSPTTEEAIQPATTLSETEHGLLLDDIRTAYIEVGRQMSFFIKWGFGLTRPLLRVENKGLVATTPDRRQKQVISINPDELPEPQYYRPGLSAISLLKVDQGPRVTAFFSSYRRYRAALSLLVSEGDSFETSFITAMEKARDTVDKGRDALCALGEAPPILFPQGGFMEPAPPDCLTDAERTALFGPRVLPYPGSWIPQ